MVSDEPESEQKTAERLAEHRLKQCYEVLFRMDPNAIVTADSGGLIASANDQAAHLFGYAKGEEMIGLRIETFLHPDEIARAHENQLKTLTGHNPGASAYRAWTRDGRELWVELHGDLLLGENGLPMGWLFIARDVSAVSHVQNVMREDLELQRAIFDKSPLATSVRSPRGQLLAYNQAWRNLWNMPDEAIRDDMTRLRTCLQFDEADEYLKPHFEALRRVYEQGGMLFLPELYVKNSRPGGAEWVSHAFFSVPDTNGDVQAVVIQTRDITYHKRLVTSLQTLRQVQGALIRALPQAALVYRVAEPNAVLLEDGNAAAERLGGFRVAEARGEEFRLHWPSLAAKGMSERCLNAVRLEKTDEWVEDDPLGAGEGSRRFRLVPLSNAYLLMLIDRSEGELWLKPSGERTTFLRELADQNPQVVALIADDGRIAYLNRAGRRLLRVGPEQDLSSFNLTACIPPERRSLLRSHILPMLLKSGQVSGEGEFWAADGAPFWLAYTTLPIAMPEIVPSSLCLAILAHTVSVPGRVAPAADGAMPRAREDGRCKTASEALQRLNGHLTSIKGHASLALMDVSPKHPLYEICREVLDACEASIAEVNGVKDLFHEETAVAHAERGHETVLFVDDEPSVCSLAEQVLTQAGYRVYTALHAAEALRVFREATPPVELLLTDIMMPGVSGIALAQQLVADHPGLRVLFSSAYTAWEQTAPSALQRRAPFLPKPYTPQDLLAAVRQLLDDPDYPRVSC